MARTTHTVATKGSASVKTIEQDGIFISTVWVNYGETITGQRATHKTLAGAKRWAKKVL